MLIQTCNIPSDFAFQYVGNVYMKVQQLVFGNISASEATAAERRFMELEELVILNTRGAHLFTKVLQCSFKYFFSDIYFSLLFILLNKRKDFVLKRIHLILDITTSYYLFYRH